MFKKIFAIIVASFLVTTNSYASTVHFNKPPEVKSFRYEEDHGINGGNIEIQGEINRQASDVTAAAFKDFKKNHIKSVIIHLNSLGGDVDEGVKISTEMLRAEKEGITVGAYVDHKEVCASMCTAIFATAQWRATAPDTLWVFHSPMIELTDAEQIQYKSDPKFRREVDKDRDITRKVMLDMYGFADEDWAKHELKKYIYSDDETGLVLTGGQIMDHSVWFVSYYLEN